MSRTMSRYRRLEMLLYLRLPQKKPRIWMATGRDLDVRVSRPWLDQYNPLEKKELYIVLRISSSSPGAVIVSSAEAETCPIDD